MATNNNTQDQPRSPSNDGHRQQDQHVQDRMRRLSLRRDDMEVDQDATSSTAGQTQGGSYKEAFEALQELEDQIQEKMAAFRTSIKEKKPTNQQTKAFKELADIRKCAEEYRLICKEQYPDRLELYTWEEINQQKQQASNTSQDHVVPKELPALQCIGSDRWHPNKALHLSTEMFARAFENELNAAGLDHDKHWRRLLPKCLNDAQNIWLPTEVKEHPDLDWQEIRSRMVAKYDTPEQQLKSMEMVFHMRQHPHGLKEKIGQHISIQCTHLVIVAATSAGYADRYFRIWGIIWQCSFRSPTYEWLAITDCFHAVISKNRP
ncbi:predicted protein [Lichtheimia corymbifera JMRC:FSU:9682]|uniref:Uncharacterized protein n=1 Tax=Lichtheimia corymbifera JMRC:FSU:9682 TaxID=1263082 RepID=A0A068SFC9_9FUNG|nr:predicted protein [Lichtheimia corymbifera JMRC:FSU:9682]